jgi:WhiB family redox-sensing transcriptional regulator
VEHWADSAACKDAPLRWFFPEKGTSGDWAYVVARSLCGSCPVRAECLAAVMAKERSWERFGMWGGKTPKERAAARGAA